MNNKIKDLLEKIEEDKKQYGESIYTQIEKTNEDEIIFFNNWIVKYIKNGFPEYIDFIKIVNGLNYNGLYIFSLNEHPQGKPCGIKDLSLKSLSAWGNKSPTPPV